ncbi:hypothetical protein ACKKBG_A28665 [Auxenochlorella protothecoides x Auxenochlorella symbiontica]
MDIPPNQTVYISNLYEKLNKDEAKKLLYALFGQFGKVLDVVVMKGAALRGKAWVVFADVGAATDALRAMQDFPFFDKPLRLSFAKSKSEVITRLEAGSKKAKKDKKPAEAAKDAETAPALANGRGSHAPSATPAQRSVDVGEPNQTLFVENLPEATTADMLSMLFSQYNGFVEIRMVEARPGIAFIDFSNDAQSGVALSGLNGFHVTPQHALKITYAKR